MRARHRYFTAGPSYFRDEGPSRKPLCISGQSEAFGLKLRGLGQTPVTSCMMAWHYSRILSEAPAAWLHDGMMVVHQDAIKALSG
jgi:hypothetical protein